MLERVTTEMQQVVHEGFKLGERERERERERDKLLINDVLLVTMEVVQLKLYDDSVKFH